uniref:Transmembrane p24 trafficking protein 9 n=1 Tax=Acanthochromis polyacanthus TaxID=80966 RepID=A0A3Q1GES7_9TELE
PTKRPHSQILYSEPFLGRLHVFEWKLEVILSRQYGSEGRFTFTSHTPGEHQICLHSNSSKFSLFAGGMLRVHLDIQVGEHANNYAEIAAKDKLTELQLRVRQLVEQVDQIQKEQNYQRVRRCIHCGSPGVFVVILCLIVVILCFCGLFCMSLL